MKNRKNIYGIIVILAAVAITTYCIILNVYCAFLLPVCALIAFDNKMKLKHKLVLAAIFLIISFPTVMVAEYIFQKLNNDPSIPFRDFILSSIFSAIFLIFPFFLIFRYFINKVGLANPDYANYFMASKYPNLICTQHLTKIRLIMVYGEKYISCRINEKCLTEKKIIYAKHLVGLIGKIDRDKRRKGNYYVTLWNHKTQEMRNGDYDIIEFHKNNEIEDYNSLIAKIVSYFYNELNRYKPINEVIVRIIGDIEISESTKRWLEKNFLKVEYASN
jgi:hypothetical protein